MTSGVSSCRLLVLDVVSEKHHMNVSTAARWILLSVVVLVDVKTDLPALDATSAADFDFLLGCL